MLITNPMSFAVRSHDACSVRLGVFCSVVLASDAMKLEDDGTTTLSAQADWESATNDPVHGYSMPMVYSDGSYTASVTRGHEVYSVAGEVRPL